MPALTGVQASVIAGGVESIRYVLHNNAGSGLVAVEIVWEIHSPEGAVQVSSVEDDWATRRAFLEPGSFVEQTYDGYIRSRSRNITKIVGAVSYAEYTDGTKLGDERAAARFSSRRRDFVDACRALLRTYSEQGSDGLVAALSSRDAKGTVAQTAAKSRILGIYRSDGLSAALSEISRVINVPLP